MSSSSASDIIRQVIQQHLPYWNDPISLDTIVDTMACARNSYVIFFIDASGTILFELKTVGAIKRLGFKNKLLNSTENPIFAITYDFVRKIDLYDRNNNFERETLDDLQGQPGAHARSSTSSTYPRLSTYHQPNSLPNSWSAGPSGYGLGSSSDQQGAHAAGSSAYLLRTPDSSTYSHVQPNIPPVSPLSPQGNEAYDALKRHYEEVRRSFYGS